MAKLTKEKLVKRANKLFKREEFEKCLKAINKILTRYPEELDIYFLKIESLYGLEKDFDIEKIIRDYLDNSPKEEENYLVAAEYIDKSKPIYEFESEAEAESEYNFLLGIIDEGLKSHHESYELTMLKASVFMNMPVNDDIHRFVEYIDSFSHTDLFWKDLKYYKAIKYRDFGKYEKALDVYDEILKYSPDLETISRKLKTLKLLDHENEAIELLDNMIADDKVSENEKNWALVNKGLYYEGIDNQKAMGFIDEAIRNNPDYGFSYLGKASILYDMGEYIDSKKSAHEALSLDKGLSENYDFLFLLAKLDFEDGDSNSISSLSKKINRYQYISKDLIDFMLRTISSKISKLSEMETFNDEDISSDNHSNILDDDEESIDRFEMFDNLENAELFKKIQESKEGLESFEEDDLKLRLFETSEQYEEILNDFIKEKGEDYFKENDGEFWEILDNRMFLILLSELSDVLWEEGRKKDSIDKLKYSMELDSKDNLYRRYILFTRLLELNKLDETEEYFEMFEEEYCAFMYYSKLLFAIKNNEDKTVIKSIFKEAIGANKHVPSYLLGKRSLPKKPIVFFPDGTVEEAMYYSKMAYNAWNDDERVRSMLKDLIK